MREQLCEKEVVTSVEVIERVSKMLVGVGLVRPALHNLCNSLRSSFCIGAGDQIRYDHEPVGIQLSLELL